MAEPHLVRTTLGAGASAQTPLVAADGHLLVLRHTSVWANISPQDLLITPSAEYFSQAVTWGIDSNFNAMMTSNSDAGALALQTRLAAIRDAKTTNSWVEGHRPLYAYWARSFPPYRIKADPNIDNTKLRQTMELGACWRLLRFGFRGLPTHNGSVFNAWWRVWNPSCLADVDSAGLGVNHYVKAWTQLHRGAGIMRYKFDGEVHPPSFHQNTGYGEADISAIANDGNGNGFAANMNCIPYDIWGSHNGVASATNNYHGYEHVRIWARKDAGGIVDRSPYFVDIPITGDGLASLKAALSSGKGAVWAHCGFPIVDAQSAESGANGQAAYTTFLLYCSRLELRISVSWGTLN